MTSATIATARGVNTAVQRVGEVANDGACASGIAQRARHTLELGRSIEDELREEGVEVDEVTMHHTLCDARLRSDGPARQPAHAVSSKHLFRGLEQQLSSVGEVDSGRHR